jgi:translation initiation factor IF-3
VEHKELGDNLAARVRDSIADVANVEQDIQMEGNRLNVLFVPKK